MRRYDLSALVSTDLPGKSVRRRSNLRSFLKLKALRLEKFGLNIEQVGFKRIAYEQANVAAVLAQMKAEREAEAKQLRAEGDKESRRIRDDASGKERRDSP